MSVSAFFICSIFAALCLLIITYIITEELNGGLHDFTCDSCGHEFDKEEVEVYLASEDDGLSFKFYDACDCPNCGCQNILCRRLDSEETTE